MILCNALDTMTEKLDYAMSVVRHLESVATTPELRAAFNAVQPKVSAFYSSIPLNERLWKSIQRYAATGEARALTGTLRRYLTKTIDAFKRHGAELDPAGKTRLQEIDIQLAELTTKFSENVLDSTNAWDLVITDEARLAGLPPSAVAAARAAAVSKQREGWRFTLQAPSYLAVMTYLDDAAIREQMWRAYNARAASGDHDNRTLIARIVALRQEKARLLGFRDFADLVLDDRMAHTGETAQHFIDDLRRKTERRFREENRELEAFANRELQPWDVGYWAEKQRAALYDFDEEALRPYFPLERVVAGMFDIFGRILGIRVDPEQGVPGWDPEVRCYAIHDRASNAYLGSFYADWFPRENKRGGAWMDTLITGNPAKSEPHLGLICGNLTPPVDGEAGAADPSRSGNHLSRVRPSAASSVEPRGGPQPFRNQRRLGFRGAALADHGELVLGARVAGLIRAPFRNRRCDSGRAVQENEASQNVSGRQRPDAAAWLRVRRPGAASGLGPD